MRAQCFMVLVLNLARNLSRHVDKAGIVPLECYRHGGGRAVPVFGHDQVRLACTRRLLLVLVLAVQKDNDIRVLLDTIMKCNSIGDEIMSFEHCRIIDWLMSDTFNMRDGIPKNVVCGEHFQLRVIQNLCNAPDSCSCRIDIWIKVASALCSDCHLNAG
jgi:hypothetical protein